MTAPARYELHQLRDDTGEEEPDSPWRKRAIQAFDQLRARKSPRTQRNAQVKLMPNGVRFALTFEYPEDDDAWHFGPVFEVVREEQGERLALYASADASLGGKSPADPS